MNFDLEGKGAIVTGGSLGIGRAIALELAREGANVAVNYRRHDDEAKAVAAEIEESTGRQALSAACHLGDWDALGVLAERVYDEFGRVDVLVNNAGINPAPTAVADITSEYFDKLFGVNVKGPVRLAGLIGPRMAAAGSGSIINITTVGSYMAGPYVGAYTAGKAALLNFTRTMASEWADSGVRVNAIAPGPFMTEMMKGMKRLDEASFEGARDATLMKRVADPEEIVPLALYLASDASSYVTGEDFAVAGGMRSN
ncbi:MAG: SDR family NAD(P)-dependent oxidoreductase [Acidimicrobiales bacterium]